MVSQVVTFLILIEFDLKNNNDVIESCIDLCDHFGHALFCSVISAISNKCVKTPILWRFTRVLQISNAVYEVYGARYHWTMGVNVILWAYCLINDLQLKYAELVMTLVRNKIYELLFGGIVLAWITWLPPKSSVVLMYYRWWTIG